jgi:DNA-binding CsgD family transcriptional regulator
MIGAMVLCRRFVARDAELQLLDERYRAASAGRGSMVLVGGEAGIGKTRFLAEVRSRLTARGARLIGAGALEHTESPLGPLVEVLHELDAADPVMLQREPMLRMALARLFPGLVESHDPAPTAPADARRGQFAAMAEALRRFATDATTVVVLDDLHWADVATLDFLQYIVKKIGTFGLVVVIAYRSDELHRRHPLTPVIAKLTRHDVVWQIDLTPLGDAETRTFVHATLEDRAPLDARRVREIVELSEGSPLFIEELLKHALETAHSGGGRVELPLSIRSSVLDRLADFDERERSVLSHAAAVGRQFDAEFLAQVEGRPLDDVTAVLRRARDAQLIVEKAGAAAQFGFRHALIREAIYSELLAAEARPLHARIAAGLEVQPNADERVIELAYHWWAARIPEKAADANERAGDLAARRLAHESAATFYERALEFVADSPQRQAQLFEKLGEVLRIAGLAERSRRALERALVYYREHGPWDKVVELSMEIARQYWLTSDMGDSVAWRERAFEMVRDHPEHRLYFATLIGLANHHALRGDLVKADEYFEQTARATGERGPRHVVGFENTAGLIAGLRGDWTGVNAHYRRSISLARDVDDPQAEVLARFNLGYLATAFGEWEAAIDGFESAAGLARARFIPGHEAYALAGYAGMRYVAGDLETARALIEEALSVVDELLPGLRVQVAGVAIPIGLRLEDATLVDRFAREDNIELAFRSRESQRIAPICAAFAEWYVQRGQSRLAVDILHRAIDAIPSAGERPWSTLALAQYGSRDDHPRGRALLARWAEHPHNRAGKAYLALYDALLAGGAAEAGELAERAERALARLRMPLWQALALELAGRPVEALELYRRVGDRRSVRRLEGDLAAPNRRGRAKNELTEREREVRALVASGNSNRAIASALTISERTVEHHLASIFSKLGVASRAEVVALAARERTQ